MENRLAESRAEVIPTLCFILVQFGHNSAQKFSTKKFVDWY